MRIRDYRAHASAAMEIHHFLLIWHLIALASLMLDCAQSLNRTDFPAGFIFGAGSSAYQHEGAAYQDGKGSSIWDTFTRMHPEKIVDHSTGRIIADEFFYRFQEDIALMKQIGIDSFRFSISWPRILPKGKISEGVNQDGVTFYNNIINVLLYQGLQPFVTLFHWDLPRALEDEYLGFLSPNIVDDYRHYVDFCFKAFGDRVKVWITINEPNSFALRAYALGTEAPGRCSDYIGNCTFGNSATEPYIVAHHMLLARSCSCCKIVQRKVSGFTNGTNWDYNSYILDSAQIPNSCKQKGCL